MAGLFFKSDSERDFSFHLSRMEKLLTNAQNKFDRADGYLCGEGLGNDSLRLNSAKGAIGKAHRKLREALFNAQDAVKYANNDPEKIRKIKMAVDGFIAKDGGNNMFAHPSVIDAWSEAMNQWTKELNEIL